MRLKALICAALMLFLCIDAGAQASAQKDRKARLEKEIRLLEEQLRDNKKKSNNAESQMNLLHRKIASRRDLLKESESELKAIDDSLSAKEAQIAAVQKRLDTLQHYYGRLVRNAYKKRDSRVWYMYLLASEDIGQATRRYGYLRSLSTQMNTQAKRIVEAREELELRRGELEQLRAEARKVRDTHAYEVGKLQHEENDALLLIKQLQKDKKKYQAQISSKRKQVEDLNKEISRIINSAIGSGSKTSAKAKTSTKIDTKLSDEFASNCGRLPWPVEGVVVDHFGQHYHPVYKTIKLPFNNGVNVATAKDAEVKAVFDGVVKQVIVMPGYNQCVLIQHGEFFTFYCKLGTVRVKAGDKVKTGQTVGTVVSSGDETQLHFQLWQGRSPQDPETWLKSL